MLLLLRLFHFFKSETLTPCLVAIEDNVSPLLTLYVEADDVPECAVDVFDPDVDAGAPPPL